MQAFLADNNRIVAFLTKNSFFILFVCLFLSFQQAINKTGAFIEDLRSDPNENRDINMLVAFQALESFLVDYWKVHSRADKGRAVKRARPSKKV